MPTPGIFCPRMRTGRFDRVLPFFLLSSALLFLLCGAALLVRLEIRGPFSALQSLFACGLLCFAAVQGRIAWDVFRQMRRNKSLPKLRWATFVRWMLVGMLLSYAAALAWHPRPDAKWLFALGVTLWFTLAWLPLWNQARVQAFYRQLLTARGVRNIARVTCGLLLAICLAEVGLRGYGLLFGQPLRAISSAKLAIAAEAGVSLHKHAATFHVAAVGGPDLLKGAASRHVLEQLEQLLPGTDVRHVSRTEAESVSQNWLASDVFAARPDLVLWFVSPDEELSRATPESDWFDWRNVRLATAVAGYVGVADSTPAVAEVHQADRQSQLSSCELRLIACRTPLDETMHARWAKLESELKTVAAACHRQKIPLAIVLVPGDFQINRELSDAARRRLGWEAAQVDLELPQRRLAAFAAQEKVVIYDLLPCLLQAEECPYARHASHWNDMGHELAAISLGRWVNARYGTMIASAAQAKVR